MCEWLTSEMPTFSDQCHKTITSSVDQSLEWKMLARWLSCIVQSMLEKRVEEISETTLEHACISSILLHLQLVLMVERHRLSRVMGLNLMTMFCYMWMMHWLSVKMQNLL